MMDAKNCPSCNQTKEISYFWKGQSYCIPCSKQAQKTRWQSRTPQKRLEQHLRYKYGVTPEHFLQMWDSQAGLCAICESSLPDLLVYENRRRGYAIDHDHNTGKVRGILCTECNSVLGLAGDNPDILRRAAEYLDTNGHYSRKSLVDNAWAARSK
jgi:hypothetical protein